MKPKTNRQFVRHKWTFTKSREIKNDIVASIKIDCDNKRKNEKIIKDLLEIKNCLPNFKV